ncbi:NUDIX domain-containing protein [Paenactinomyces guangxiensis]|uniref:NUDIX domain-containing protein n=1 Tax=Paenactinomyces guangxiensis TaxID=1490290 RepID=A0A7W1WPR9_9BACL|nr:NUDIX domain-containing protein [Paenactinomyces guangxiensis]MBH8591276.1 NUDIX domain-containing protein [Paenactinomyces guangxiensis]
MPGYYELPGGQVNFGEDPNDALRRDFYEEVNLKITVPPEMVNR